MRKQLKKIKNESLEKKYRRKLSIRRKIQGTTVRPRLCAVKTNKNISVQVIDDSKSVTIFSLHTFGKNAVPGASSTIEGVKVFGSKLASELKKRGLENAVFDRNGRTYTGVLASLVESVRENGILI